MRIIIIAPHPDDELLGPGGTLLRRKSEGAILGWVIMTKISEDTGWSKNNVQERENEIEKVTSHIRAQGNPDYIEDIITRENNESEDLISSGEEDELYQTALKIIKTEKKASTSFLQRKLQIGYNRAARIIEKMEEKGLVSKANHVGKREVL